MLDLESPRPCLPLNTYTAHSEHVNDVTSVLLSSFPASTQLLTCIGVDAAWPIHNLSAILLKDPSQSGLKHSDFLVLHYICALR